MSELTYSHSEPGLLLLAINRFVDITKNRTDICRTQEAWIVLKGNVLATFWDIDDKVILETTLKSGDCAVVFRAGHSFEVLEKDTMLYEIKTGPYYGVEKDKTFISQGD